MLKATFIIVNIIFLAALTLGSFSVFAGVCSPGIPCTGYDIYNQNTSGVASQYSGSKTGTPAPHSNTSGATTSACDGNFMNQIYSRAFLEASREVIMSEQLIHKPDSVLEYTCFDQMVNIAAHNAGTPFSESTDWQNVEIELWLGGEHENSGSRGSHDHSCSSTCPDKSEKVTINNTNTIEGFTNQIDYSVFGADRMDYILEMLLFDFSDTHAGHAGNHSILGNYINNNFSHTFMGEAITLDNDIVTTAIGANSYACTHMSAIWDIAQCIDFGEDDRFRSFEHLVNFDPRSIPKSCSPGKDSSDSITAGSDPTKYENIHSGGGIINKMPIDLKVTTLAGVDIDIDPIEFCPDAGGPIAGVKTDFSNDIIRIANNCDDKTTSPIRRNVYSAFDVIETYVDIIKGFGLYLPGVTNGTVPGTVNCSPPLPTGIPIITYNITSNVVGGVDTMQRSYEFHYDHICPNPGCYYQPLKVPYLWGAAIPAVGSGLCCRLVGGVPVCSIP